jgi:hypothetical protein
MTTRRPKRSSFRELVRKAADAAVEFATLGEATLADRSPAAGRASAPIVEHPHRRRLGHHPRTRRPGMVSARAQVCISPVHRPARRT